MVAALLAVLVALPVTLFLTPAPATAQQAPPRAELPVVLPQMSCEQLAGRRLRVLPGEPARLTVASVVPATGTAGPQCHVRGTIAPKHVFEVDLPMDGWTQRYLQTGCGGFCGAADPAPQITAMFQCPLQEQGQFVVAYGNAGHTAASGIDPSFGEDPTVLEDYAYESEHQLSIAAKKIIKLFYGQGPQKSYFNGCSNGGRQALVLAQRYPDDFDGILAGAPANLIVALTSFSQLWNIRANTAADGSEILRLGDLPLLHAAALGACDATDGLVDGLITDPRSCDFDPGTLLCPPSRTFGCLTRAQVTAARKLYSGPVDPRGRALYPGGMPVGSELGWADNNWLIRTQPGATRLADAFSRGFLTRLSSLDTGLDVDPDRVVFDQATFRRLMSVSGFYDAPDPDLTAFRASGGKLIIWHGWNDPGIPAEGSIAYYNAMVEEMGRGRVNDFTRLYMIPGMYHCSGGDGPSQLNLLMPLVDWVESGGAPTRIVVSEQDASGQIARTRPVYPFPRVAAYDGSGSPDDAANFVGRPSREGLGEVPWIGRYGSDPFLWCEVVDGRLVCSDEPLDESGSVRQQMARAVLPQNVAQAVGLRRHG